VTACNPGQYRGDRVQSPDLFPVFLRLAGRRVLLVGGGRVAESKLAVLHRAGADVTVVAPRISPGIAGSGARVEQRRFRASDLDRKWLVISAAPPAVNRAVARAAARRRIFVNAVDDPAHATAYLGGVLYRDGVTIAVSTNGLAPALAGLLREGLDGVLPDDLARWLTQARRLRRQQRRRRVPIADRRPQLLEALTRLYESRGRRLS
jgi:uroporphyrin-III C-methyltransferase/precorrin-2 dehydrogenase/sirohydrochlorin ferrochelatase